MKGFIGLPILLAIIAVFTVAAGGTMWYLETRPVAGLNLQSAQEVQNRNQPQQQASTTAGALIFKQTAPLKIEATSGAGTVTDDMAIDFGDGTPLVKVFNDSDLASSDSSICGQGWSYVCTTSHTYTQAGTYTILIVHANGCSMTTGTCTSVGSEISHQTIAVTGPTTSAVSVPGMAKYTDSDFGFSFWYPSGWSIADVPVSDEHWADTLRGTGRVRLLKLMDGSRSMYISEATSTQVYASGCGTCWEAIYFDPKTNQWLDHDQNRVGDTRQDITYPVDITQRTMGGLPGFWGGDVFAIGPNKFISFSTDYVSGETPLKISPLSYTLVATDPSVATPVSAAEQTKAIQAEQAAYEQNQGSGNGSGTFLPSVTFAYGTQGQLTVGQSGVLNARSGTPATTISLVSIQADDTALLRFSTAATSTSATVSVNKTIGFNELAGAGEITGFCGKGGFVKLTPSAISKTSVVFTVEFGLMFCN